MTARWLRRVLHPFGHRHLTDAEQYNALRTAITNPTRWS